MRSDGVRVGGDDQLASLWAAKASRSHWREVEYLCVCVCVCVCVCTHKQRKEEREFHFTVILKTVTNIHCREENYMNIINSPNANTPVWFGIWGVAHYVLRVLQLRRSRRCRLCIFVCMCTTADCHAGSGTLRGCC